MKVLMDVYSFKDLSETAKKRVREEYGRDVINSYHWDSFLEPYREASKKMGVEVLLFDIDRTNGGIIIFGIVNRLSAATSSVAVNMDDVEIKGRMVFVQDEPGEMSLYLDYTCDNQNGVTQGIMKGLVALSDALASAWNAEAGRITTEAGLDEFFSDLDARFLEDGTWIKTDSANFGLLN